MNPNPYLSPIASPAIIHEPPVLAQLAGEEEGLSVDCVIELEDVISFSIYQNMRSPFGRKQFLKRWLLIGLSMIVLSGMVFWVAGKPGLIPNVEVVMIAAAVFVIAYVALYPWNYAWRLRKGCVAVYRSGRNLALFGPRRTTLTPGFLIHSSPYTQSLARWVAVERVDLQPTALYLYVSSNSGFIIPRRAFVSEEDFQTFGRAAEDYRARALSSQYGEPRLAGEKESPRTGSQVQQSQAKRL